jgi:hypothetical protein
MAHRFYSGFCIRCGMSEREASDGFVCLPRWTVKLAVAIIVVSLVFFAIGVMGLCRAAWGDTLPGCCTTSSGTTYTPDTLFGSVNHGCATGDTWTAAPCSLVQPTPTPTPMPTPGRIRPPRRNLSPCSLINPLFHISIPTMGNYGWQAVIQCGPQTCTVKHDNDCFQLYPWTTWTYSTLDPGVLVLKCPTCFNEISIYTEAWAYSVNIFLDPDLRIRSLFVEWRNCHFFGGC